MSGAGEPRAQVRTAPKAWLQRLSPIPKLAWGGAGLAVALVTFDPLPLLAIAGAGLILAATSGLLRPLLRALLAFGPLVASILLIQLLAPIACRPACTPVASLGPLTVYAEGMGTGLSFAARLLAIQVVAFVVALSTASPDLFAALDRLHVPRSISFASAMTLQLVPDPPARARDVLSAQRARGLRAAGPTALARSLVPVMVASAERVERISITLETRGFGGSARRTSLHVVAFGRAEALLALAGLVAGVVGVVAGLAWWGVGSAPVIEVAPAVALAVVLAAIVVLVGMLARGVILVYRA